jgi:selenocysteine lyase/cysteine desulfurase
MTAFRARFPALADTVYLASCSLGARSLDVTAALGDMLDDMAWPAFEEQVAQARTRFAALIGARPDEVAIVPNASVGAFQVASTVDWTRRPRLVTTDAEFPSLSHVWLAQRPRGAEVTHVPAEHDRYLAAIDGRTALVSVPAVTYQHAARLPVAEIAAAAHAVGARVFVDAYQAVGVLPVDVTALGCDYLVAGTLKYLLGLPGLAFLYVRDGVTDDLPPQLTGWFGRVDPFAFDPHGLDFPATARRFETGTPAVPACYAANAGLALIAGLDLSTVDRQVGELVALAAATLVEIGVTVREPGVRGAHVAFVDEDPQRLADRLAARRIVVSPRGDTVRLSFHHYNNADDVAAVCAAVRELRGTHA